MSSVNSITLVGRVGQDPEMKYTTSGMAVTNFRLATNRLGKNNETDWHGVTCWKDLAERVNEYVKKGSLVCVQGSVQYSKWEGSNGEKKERTIIAANNVTFLDTKKKKDSDDDLPFE